MLFNKKSFRIRRIPGNFRISENFRIQIIFQNFSYNLKLPFCFHLKVSYHITIRLFLNYQTKTQSNKGDRKVTKRWQEPTRWQKPKLKRVSYVNSFGTKILYTLLWTQWVNKWLSKLTLSFLRYHLI